MLANLKAVIGGLLIATAGMSAHAAPVYESASFGGGLFSVTSSMVSRLASAQISGFTNTSCFNCATPAPVTGHLIFDSSVPIPASGFSNVFSIGAIANVSNNAIFELDIGGLSFRFGDAGIQGGPAIQYKNGVFNGIFFDETFNSPNSTPLELSVQGSAFTLRNGQFQTLLSGFITVGGNGLTNIQSFTPPGEIQPPAGNVPEPASLALAGLGLVGLGWTRRRKAVKSA